MAHPLLFSRVPGTLGTPTRTRLVGLPYRRGSRDSQAKSIPSPPFLTRPGASTAAPPAGGRTGAGRRYGYGTLPQYDEEGEGTKGRNCTMHHDGYESARKRARTGTGEHAYGISRSALRFSPSPLPPFGRSDAPGQHGYGSVRVRTARLRVLSTIVSIVSRNGHGGCDRGFPGIPVTLPALPTFCGVCPPDTHGACRMGAGALSDEARRVQETER